MVALALLKNVMNGAIRQDQRSGSTGKWWWPAPEPIQGAHGSFFRTVRRQQETIHCLCLLVMTTMGFLTTGTFQMRAGTSIGAVPVDPAAKPLQPCWMESSACQPGLSESRTLQPIRTRLKHNLQWKADFQMSYYSIASATTTSTTITMSIFTPTGSIFTQSTCRSSYQLASDLALYK